MADAEAERARQEIEEAGAGKNGDQLAAPATQLAETRRSEERESPRKPETQRQEMVRIIHLRADFHPSMLVQSPGRFRDEYLLREHKAGIRFLSM